MWNPTLAGRWLRLGVLGALAGLAGTAAAQEPVQPDREPPKVTGSSGGAGTSADPKDPLTTSPARVGEQLRLFRAQEAPGAPGDLAPQAPLDVFAAPDRTAAFQGMLLRTQPSGTPTLGMMVAPASEALRSHLDLSPDEGLVVTGVTPGGPADAAGVKRNDVLLRIQDHVLNRVEVLNEFANAARSKPLSLALLRAGKRITVEIKPLQSVIVQFRSLAPEAPARPRNEFFLGVAVGAVDETLRAQLELAEGRGVIVLSVVEDSPAARAGLKINDILLEMDQHPLSDIRSLIAQVQAAGQKQKAVPIALIRGGKRISIDVQPEKRKDAPPTAAPPQPGQFRLVAPGVILDGSGGGPWAARLVPPTPALPPAAREDAAQSRKELDEILARVKAIQKMLETQQSSRESKR